MPPQLHIYPTNAELPAAVRYQVHSFMRVVWFDYDEYNVDLTVEEDEAQPSHIAVTNGSTLIAYATVVWKNLTHAGETYRCGGLANVMTFPHFRKRGYGGAGRAKPRLVSSSSQLGPTSPCCGQHTIMCRFITAPVGKPCRKWSH